MSKDQATERNKRQGPLKGLKVLELAHVMAGPTCGRLLADLGADVIKVERPGGEDSRHMAPPWVGSDSAAYVMMNRNKRNISIDLKQAGGKRAFLDIAKDCDVVIENFRKGTLERLGLGFETLEEVNPGLILCSISGYGRTGPMAQDGGFDLMAQAMSGLMSFTGESAERPPVKVGAPVADIGAGMLACIGVLAALQERTHSGRGQQVDTSLFEAGIFYTLWQSAIYLAGGGVPEPIGSAHPLDGPYQAFATSDGWIVVGAANQANWLRLTKALRADDLASDPRFVDNPARMKNLAELVTILNRSFSDKSSKEWLDTLAKHNVPASPILAMDAVAAHEQAKARDMFVAIDHHELGAQQTVGLPVKLSRTPGVVTGAPCSKLGQDAAEILREAGWSDAEINAAFESHAVPQ
ncbi:MAG: CoA transferase [Pseudomonadota bacterium]